MRLVRKNIVIGARPFVFWVEANVPCSRSCREAAGVGAGLCKTPPGDRHARAECAKRAGREPTRRLWTTAA
jgi:hypothetical protein